MLKRINDISLAAAGILLLAVCGCAKPRHYDVIVIGGTPGGIMSAIAAAREGENVLLLERSSVIGGLPANGLGATDIATRNSTTGLFLEFVNNVKQYYVEHYGEESEQVRSCSDGYHFEPHVAGEIFADMLGGESDRITVRTGMQFDCVSENIRMCNGSVKWVKILDRSSGRRMKFKAAVFVDATYEGDLGAAAGAPFRVGRESREEFGEPGAGKIYKYWEGAEDSGSSARKETGLPLGEGSTGEADKAVQAYNFRLCLTSDPSNRIPFYQPENYDREEYVSMVDDVLSGRNTNYLMAYVTQTQMDRNRVRILSGGQTEIPGDPWGVAKLTNMVSLPNGKTDANNQHQALISTDLPEENWSWPVSGWEWRDAFAERLKNYTLGLFWFAATDESLPESFRRAVGEWGLAADEYEDNGGFPRMVYVREGRRFEGEYFFTASDAVPADGCVRPPVHWNSVTASHYALDSHGVRKREPGRIHLDGFLSYPTKPYTVPYGVMVSPKIKNVLLPVPVSGSHIGFSTLRMEPCWMALGQAAGIAAHIAKKDNVAVGDIDIRKLQDSLLDGGSTLFYFSDMRPGDEDFSIVQHMGLAGYFPDWTASLDSTVSAEDIALWEKTSALDLSSMSGKSRRETIRYIYEKKYEDKH